MQRDLENGCARLTFEDRIVWLVHYDADSYLASQQLEPCIDSVVAGLKESGVSPTPSTCDHCERRATLDVFHHGHVMQVCDLCNAAHSSEPKNPQALPIMWGWLTLEIVRGILIWCILNLIAIQISSTWTRLTGMKHIYVPHVMELFMLLGASWLVGSPIGKRVAKSNLLQRRSKIIGGTACVAALLAGELLWTTWVLHAETGAWSPTASAKILPYLWWEQGVHAVLRLVVAGFAVYWACITSVSAVKPPAPKRLK